jgi:hypothetical protein
MQESCGGVATSEPAADVSAPTSVMDKMLATANIFLQRSEFLLPQNMRRYLGSSWFTPVYCKPGEHKSNIKLGIHRHARGTAPPRDSLGLSKAEAGRLGALAANAKRTILLKKAASGTPSLVSFWGHSQVQQPLQSQQSPQHHDTHPQPITCTAPLSASTSNMHANGSCNANAEKRKLPEQSSLHAFLRSVGSKDVSGMPAKRLAVQKLAAPQKPAAPQVVLRSTIAPAAADSTTPPVAATIVAPHAASSIPCTRKQGGRGKDQRPRKRRTAAKNQKAVVDIGSVVYNCKVCKAGNLQKKSLKLHMAGSCSEKCNTLQSMVGYLQKMERIQMLQLNVAKFLERHGALWQIWVLTRCQ